MNHRIALAAGGLIGALTLTASAGAWTIDEATGRLVADDAAVIIPFDDLAELPEEAYPEFSNDRGLTLTRGALAAAYEADPDGLEGSGALRFGGELFWGRIHLVYLWEHLQGRRVEVRLWQKPQGTRARITLDWSTFNEDAIRRLGQLPLRPTGRATDDGWLEYSSGPVDFSAGGFIGPLAIEFMDQQAIDHAMFEFTTTSAVLTTLIDALEIVDLGPAAVAPVGCTITEEAERCGAEGLCLYGRCVDGAIVIGPVPQEEEVRRDYLTRRLFEYRTFEGGRLPRLHYGELEAALEPLKAGASAGQFWPTLKAAIESTSDGHSYAPLAFAPQRASIDACLHVGEADLLPGGGELPLVFSVAAENPVTALLEPGDALVAVDGVPPGEWVHLVKRHLLYGGDPAGLEHVAAPELVRAAVLGGSTLTFARCSRSAEQLTPCEEHEVQRFDVDLADHVGSGVWSGRPPLWGEENATCDYRFQRADAAAPTMSMTRARIGDDPRGTWLEINALPAYEQPGGSYWHTIVAEALEPSPERMILDQRLGQGGYAPTVLFLVAPLLAEEDFFAVELVPWLERPFDAQLRDRLASCFDGNGQYCGGFRRWRPGEQCALDCPRGASAGTRLAILNGSDRSGNDYTTKLLTYRGAPTRVFGPAPTWGAFGPIVYLPRHYQEIDGGALQDSDSLFLRHTGDDNTDFTTGVGVAPHEVVLQLQSDILRGRDTVLEAAWAWLSEE